MRTTMVEGASISLRKLRADAKDRPRCKKPREQEIAVRNEKGVLVTLRRKRACNMLLDRHGKCWFCGAKARR